MAASPVSVTDEIWHRQIEQMSTWARLPAMAFRATRDDRARRGCVFDRHKRVKGCKYHLLVDTSGMVVARRVEPAGIPGQKADAGMRRTEAHDIRMEELALPRFKPTL